MIDFELAKLEFKKYLKNYDLNDGNIMLKVTHTYGVVEMSEYVSKSLKLDEENIELAKLIGLLHDIGRFEQLKLTSDYEDYKGLDHAEYGIKILFEENLIRKFIKEDKYDDIIYKAIKNHNKYYIESGLSDIELLHCQIIRDADKLDNFRVKDEEKLENIMRYDANTINYETITPKVYDDFVNCKLISVRDRTTQIDVWVSFIAFIFDLTYDVSREYIKVHNYVNKMIDRIEYKDPVTKQQMENIRKVANDYLEKVELHSI